MATQLQLSNQEQQLPAEHSLSTLTPSTLDRRRRNSEIEYKREIGKLVRRIFLVPDRGTVPRLVVFTGVDQDASASAICARAAATLAAQVSESVCAVDANLRSPSLHLHFGLQNERGLTDVVERRSDLAEVAGAVTRNNLRVLTNGSEVEDCDAFLNSDHLRAQIAAMRSQFGYVLINAPAIGRYPDPIVLGHLADGIVLVLEAEATRRETAAAAKQEIEAARVHLLGAVLHNRRYPVPTSVYSRL